MTEAELARLQVPAYGLRQLSSLVGVELGEEDLDKPLPDLGDARDVQGHQSRFTVVTELARREQLTIRQLLVRLGGGRGHRTFSGTPEQIADTLENWFEAGAADGFNVMPPLLPSGLESFVEHVVPLLRRRGLFRNEYVGNTLREHYGLPLPINQFSARRVSAASA